MVTVMGLHVVLASSVVRGNVDPSGVIGGNQCAPYAATALSFAAAAYTWWCCLRLLIVSLIALLLLLPMLPLSLLLVLLPPLMLLCFVRTAAPTRPAVTCTDGVRLLLLQNIVNNC